MMFADDTNIGVTAKTLTELKLAIIPELTNLNRWLKANRLSLNVAKTRLMKLGSRQRLNVQCDEIDIEMDGGMITVNPWDSVPSRIDSHGLNMLTKYPGKLLHLWHVKMCAALSFFIYCDTKLLTP